MTLSIRDARNILKARLGLPIKDVKYVLGFKLRSGRVLAIHNEANETRIWYQPPRCPPLPGITPIANAKNADLNGDLHPLTRSDTERVEIADAAALNQFLDWYAEVQAGPSNSASSKGSTPEAQSSEPSTQFPTISVPTIDRAVFVDTYKRFQKFVTDYSGRPFVAFDEGMAAVWEDYKPRLRDYARTQLAPETWSEAEIGTGAIAKRAIKAIEIEKRDFGEANNLVFWQNRFGHANREHRVLLDALQNRRTAAEVERLLFSLYRSGEDEGATFETLSELSGRKYPFLAYLFFLKDMDRFMPIQPTGFDRAFAAMGFPLRTRGQCRWENYVAFNETLDRLRPLIADVAKLRDVRLVDAHSYCWIFAYFLKLEAEGKLESARSIAGNSRKYGRREICIIEMRQTVENTAKYSNGQIVDRTVKSKELRMTGQQLEQLIAQLLDIQENRCALSGIPFDFGGSGADKALLPSVDRIDSNGHYEDGNLQIVCRFINAWKSDSDDEEFRRLLALVRGDEGLNPLAVS